MVNKKANTLAKAAATTMTIPTLCEWQQRRRCDWVAACPLRY